MKQSIKFLCLITSVLLISCRTDESTTTENETEDNFFNINVGNQWVYKTYENPDFTNPQSTYTFSGRIDSVSIVENVTVQGLIFAKQKTKTTYPNSNLNGTTSYKYVRVNAKGHLVYYPVLDNIQVTETGGHVLHPGKDFTYTYNNPIIEGSPEPIGNVLYKLHTDADVTVEGATYRVSPYKGEFTPTSPNSGLIAKTQDISYKKGLGLVKEICHAVHGKNFLETRLVSSKIIK